jgi:hypothetical protein
VCSRVALADRRRGRLGVPSLQRIDAASCGNEPANWVAATPTAGRKTGSSDPGQAPWLPPLLLVPALVFDHLL